MIGTGYVGLSTGVGMAELGHTVVGADVDVAKVNSLTVGISPIAEAGMNESIARNVSAGRLSFTTDVLGSVKDAEVVFLCLPTPQGDDGSADLSYVQSAAR